MRFGQRRLDHWAHWAHALGQHRRRVGLGRPRRPYAQPRPPWAAVAIGTAALSLVVVGLIGCLRPGGSSMSAHGGISALERPETGKGTARRGDEIAIAGRLFTTGAPVVLWTDTGGYDAYRTTRRFGRVTPREGDMGPTGPRYNRRTRGLGAAELARIERDGWDLPTLQRLVDQFVIHYDVSGTSQQCFRVLHDVRGLSVHFMLDLDGTIYQTLDVQERAWHAGHANDRSVGIEIANIGAYRVGEREIATLNEWYRHDARGAVVELPRWLGDGGVRTPGFVARPAQPDRVVGRINGLELAQYDLTAEQYESLARLTATLSAVLPKIELRYPQDTIGRPLQRTMSAAEQERYRGLIGHYHLADHKRDPGPAFQWERVVRRAKQLRARPAPFSVTRGAGVSDPARSISLGAGAAFAGVAGDAMAEGGARRPRLRTPGRNAWSPGHGWGVGWSSAWGERGELGLAAARPMVPGVFAPWTGRP